MKVQTCNYVHISEVFEDCPHALRAFKSVVAGWGGVTAQSLLPAPVIRECVNGLSGQGLEFEKQVYTTLGRLETAKKMFVHLGL